MNISQIITVLIMNLQEIYINFKEALNQLNVETISRKEISNIINIQIKKLFKLFMN